MDDHDPLARVLTTLDPKGENPDLRRYVGAVADELDQLDARIAEASRRRRGGRGGIMQAPDVDVLARLLDAGPAGMANVALCEQTGRSEAWMAVMLKHAAEVGLCERSVSRAERAAYRLTDFGEAWVRAKLAARAAAEMPELAEGDEVVDGEAVEIRELGAGD